LIILHYASWGRRNGYSEGFRSGGFNTRFNEALPNNGFIPFDEETLSNIEIGIRSEWLDNRLRMNITYFHSVYDDLQLTSTAVGDTTFIQNVGEAEIQGVEIEGSFLLDRFRFDFGAGYLDSEFTELGGAAGIRGITLDTPFNRAPELSLNLGGRYDYPFKNGGNARIRIDWGWKDNHAVETDPNPVRQGSFGLLNASIEYTDPSERWKLAVFGTNLTDENYLVQFQRNRGLDMAVFGDRREWGVSFTYNF